MNLFSSLCYGSKNWYEKPGGLDWIEAVTTFFNDSAATWWWPCFILTFKWIVVPKYVRDLLNSPNFGWPWLLGILKILMTSPPSKMLHGLLIFVLVVVEQLLNLSNLENRKGNTNRVNLRLFNAFYNVTMWS